MKLLFVIFSLLFEEAFTYVFPIVFYSIPLAIFSNKFLVPSYVLALTS